MDNKTREVLKFLVKNKDNNSTLSLDIDEISSKFGITSKELDKILHSLNNSQIIECHFSIGTYREMTVFSNANDYI
jgi:DNA-binding IscR family transcriptional regulator